MSRGRPVRLDWGTGLRLWLAEWPAREIGAALGCPPSTVYQQAAKDRWPPRRACGRADERDARDAKIARWRCYECDPVRICTARRRCRHEPPWERVA